MCTFIGATRAWEVAQDEGLTGFCLTRQEAQQRFQLPELPEGIVALSEKGKVLNVFPVSVEGFWDSFSAFASDREEDIGFIVMPPPAEGDVIDIALKFFRDEDLLLEVEDEQEWIRRFKSLFKGQAPEVAECVFLVVDANDRMQGGLEEHDLALEALEALADALKEEGYRLLPMV